ncbi:MAG: hypothetical protein QXU18_14520 [Thermoplasmatales archaeon]
MVRTVRLDDGEDSLLKQTQERLLKYGIRNVENLPITCPKCGGGVSGISVTSEHWECHHCGYTQNGIKLGFGGTLALGAVIGTGLTALLWLLSSKEDDEE